MADADWDDQNPYASPRTAADDVSGDTEVSGHTIVILPRIRPHDVVDVLLGICQLAWIGIPAVGVPLGIACWLLGPGEVGIVLGEMGALLILSLYLPDTVWRLSVEAGGIRFKRFLGKPRFLAWSEIGRVEPVSRREAFFRGWIWPPFPLKSPGPTMTAKGHYRIDWGERYVYFPPKDPMLFEKAVRKFCPRLLGNE